MLIQTMRPPKSIGRVDVAITLLLAAIGTLLMYMNVTDPEDPAVDVSALAIPVFLLVTVPLLWRSIDPLRALGVVLAGLAIHFALFGGDVVRCGAAFPVIAFLSFAAAARLDGREALLGLGLGVAASLVVGLTDSLGFGVSSVGTPLVAICWGLGWVARSRRRMAGELRTRNEQLRRTREERARLEVATDRAQLSGELDVLLHRRLGELADLADRGSVSLADGTATAVLSDIEQRSRATLDEMRSLVGALRSDDDAAAMAPQPTLTSLEALLLREKGGDARLSVAGDPRALPAGVELSAYRVVEHLLGALDDAPGVEVGIHFAADRLELSVRGPARRRGEASAALARARERVELHQGSLRTSTHGGRAEAVAALPLSGVA